MLEDGSSQGYLPAGGKGGVFRRLVVEGLMSSAPKPVVYIEN